MPAGRERRRSSLEEAIRRSCTGATENKRAAARVEDAGNPEECLGGSTRGTCPTAPSCHHVRRGVAHGNVIGGSRNGTCREKGSWGIGMEKVAQIREGPVSLIIIPYSYPLVRQPTAGTLLLLPPTLLILLTRSGISGRHTLDLLF